MRELFLATLLALLYLTHADIGAHHVIGYVLGDIRSPGPCLCDVLTNFVRREDDIAFNSGVLVVHVHICDVLSELFVCFAGRGVEDEEKDVETGE